MFAKDLKISIELSICGAESLKKLFKISLWSECCGISSWNEKEITLQLHHKDGNHSNNKLSNLVILCPNCHSQTNTYGGKNTSK